MELRKILPAFVVHVQYRRYHTSLEVFLQISSQNPTIPIFCVCLPCVVYTYVFSSDVGHKAELAGMFCYERVTYCSNELSSLNSFSLQWGFQ